MYGNIKIWYRKNRHSFRRFVSLAVALAMVPGIVAFTDLQLDALADTLRDSGMDAATPTQVDDYDLEEGDPVPLEEDSDTPEEAPPRSSLESLERALDDLSKAEADVEKARDKAEQGEAAAKSALEAAITAKDEAKVQSDKAVTGDSGALSEANRLALTVADWAKEAQAAYKDAESALASALAAKARVEEIAREIIRAPVDIGAAESDIADADAVLAKAEEDAAAAEAAKIEASKAAEKALAASNEAAGFVAAALGENIPINSVADWKLSKMNLTFSQEGTLPGNRVESGASVSIYFNMVTASTNYNRIDDDVVYLRFEVDNPALITDRTGSGDRSYYYWGNEVPEGAPAGEAGAAYYWVRLYAQTLGSGYGIPFSNYKPFPEYVINNGDIHTVKTAVFIRDADESLQQVEAFEYDLEAVVNKFDWNEAGNPGQNDTLEMTVTLANENGAVTRDKTRGYFAQLKPAAQNPGTVSFNYQFTPAFTSPADNPRYALSYTGAVKFVEYYTVPEFLTVSLSDITLTAPAGVTASPIAAEVVNNPEEDGFTVIRAEGTFTTNNALAEIGSSVAFKVNFGNLRFSPLYTAYLNANKAFTFTVASGMADIWTAGEAAGPSFDTGDRGLYVFPAYAVNGNYETYDMPIAWNLDGSEPDTYAYPAGNAGGDYRLKGIRSGLVTYSAHKEAFQLEGPKSDSLTKKAKVPGTNENVTVIYPGDSVDFKLYGFGNKQTVPMDSFVITDRAVTRAASVAKGLDGGYDLTQIYPTKIKVGNYSGGAGIPADGGITVRVERDNDPSTLYAYPAQPYTGGGEIVFENPENITSVSIDFGRVGPGFSATETNGPVITYASLMTVADNEDIWNTAVLDYSYIPLDEEGKPIPSYREGDTALGEDGEPLFEDGEPVTHDKDSDEPIRSGGHVYSSASVKASVKAHVLENKAKLAYTFDTEKMTKGAAISAGNMPIPGEYIFFEIEVKNNYQFPVYHVVIEDVFSDFLTADYSLGGGFRALAGLKAKDLAFSSAADKGIDLREDGAPSSVTVSNTLTVTGNNSFTVAFDRDTFIAPGDTFTFTYVLQVKELDTLIGGQITNAYRAYGEYYVGEYGPGPGTGGRWIRVELGSGSWNQVANSSKTKPALTASKTIEAIPDGNVRVNLETKLRYTVVLELTQSAKDWKGDLLPIHVRGFNEMPEQNKLDLMFTDGGPMVVSAKFYPAGSSAGTDIEMSYEGRLGSQSAYNRHVYYFSFPNWPELKNGREGGASRGDRIEIALEGEFNPALFGDSVNFENKPAENYGMFLIDQKTGDYTHPGVSGDGSVITSEILAEDGTRAAAWDGPGAVREGRELHAGSRIWVNDTVSVWNLGGETLKGYIAKATAQREQINLSQDTDMTRVYQIALHNVDIKSYHLTALVDELPPFEWVERISYSVEGGEQNVEIPLSEVRELDAVPALDVYGAPLLDAEGNQLMSRVFRIDRFPSDGTLLIPPVADTNAAKVNPTSNATKTPSVTFSVTTRMEDRAAAELYLQERDDVFKGFINRAYAYYAENVVRPANLGTPKPSYTASGHTLGNYAQDAAEHYAQSNVSIKRNTIVPTTYITPYFRPGGSNSAWVPFTGNQPLPDGGAVQWQARFSNPDPSGAVMDSPVYVVALPPGFNYDGVDTGTPTPTRRIDTTDGDGGRVTVLVWENQAGVKASARTNDGAVLFKVNTFHPSTSYGEFTAYSYLVPKNSQKDFSDNMVRLMGDYVPDAGKPAVDTMDKWSIPEWENLARKLFFPEGTGLGTDYIISEETGISHYVYHFTRVSCYGQFACVSEKAVYDKSDRGNYAKGNDVGRQNYIVLSDQKQEFEYELRITNESLTKSYDQIVIVDRLPMKGDVGVVSTEESRGSALNVRLFGNGNLRAQVRGPSGTKQLAPEEFKVSYAAVGPSETFAPDDYTGLNSRWSNTYSGMETALRIAVTKPGFELKRGESLYISYDAVLNIDSAADVLPVEGVRKIAYNSFGYLFHVVGDDASRTLNPEPAKVGVTASEYKQDDRIVISKELTDGNGAPVIGAVPDEVFYFNVVAVSPEGERTVMYTAFPVKAGQTAEIFSPYNGYDYEVWENWSRVSSLAYYDNAPDSRDAAELLEATVEDFENTDYRKFIFRAVNQLKFKSAQINKEVTGTTGEGALDDGQRTFLFNVIGYEGGRVADSWPLGVTVEWTGGGWIGSSEVLDQIPIHYEYRVEEVKNDGLEYESSIEGPTVADDGRYSFTAVNEAAGVGFEIVKVLIDEHEQLDEKTFTFDVTPSYGSPLEADVTVSRTMDGKWRGHYVYEGAPFPYGTTFEVSERDSDYYTTVDIIQDEETENGTKFVFTAENLMQYIQAEIVKELDDAYDDFDTEFVFQVTPFKDGRDFEPELVTVRVGPGKNGSALTEPYPVGTTFTVEETGFDEVKYRPGEITVRENPISDSNRIQYTFRAENTRLEYVKARVTKVNTDIQPDAETVFTFSVQGTLGGEPVAPPETLVVDIGEDGAGFADTAGLYPEGTQFTVTENFDTLEKEYLEPDITIISQTRESPALTTFTFEATNTKKPFVKAVVDKVNTDTAGSRDRIFTFLVEIKGDAVPEGATETLTVDMGESQVSSAETGWYPVGSTFTVTEIFDGLTKKYRSPTWQQSSYQDDHITVFVFEATNHLLRAGGNLPDGSSGGTAEYTGRRTRSGGNPLTERRPPSDFTNIADMDIPLANLPGLTTIMDDDVPLANLPRTGGGESKGLASLGVLGFFGSIAGFVAGLLGNKKKGGDDGAK